jgi:hypothetical protein
MVHINLLCAPEIVGSVVQFHVIWYIKLIIMQTDLKTNIIPILVLRSLKNYPISNNYHVKYDDCEGVIISPLIYDNYHASCEVIWLCKHMWETHYDGAMNTGYKHELV